MSFYHILPSNVAPETYPNNTAASYTTPLGNPYNLSGKWEVGITNISYSGCLKTFVKDDRIIVTEEIKDVDSILLAKTPFYINFDGGMLPSEMIKTSNKKLQGILNITVQKRDENKYFISWKVVDKRFAIGVSQTLNKKFKLWTTAFTYHDYFLENYHPLTEQEYTAPLSTSEKYQLIVIPLTHASENIVIKKSNENIKPEEVVKRFNDKLSNLAIMKIDHGTHFTLTTTEQSKNTLIILSKLFKYALQFWRAGLFGTNAGKRFARYDFNNIYKHEWTVNVITLEKIYNLENPVPRTINLLDQFFKDYYNAVKYLSSLHKECNFTIDGSKRLTMEIKAEKVDVTFSQVLCECLGFEKLTYSGKGTFQATSPFSLNRLVKYLYIYSNLGQYCKVGDTEAPILTVVPFNSEGCETVQERIFESPIYVPLRSNYLSHIEVLLCDGTGESIRFMPEAKTVLTLHFRQIS